MIETIGYSLQALLCTEYSLPMTVPTKYIVMANYTFFPYELSYTTETASWLIAVTQAKAYKILHPDSYVQVKEVLVNDTKQIVRYQVIN